MKSFILSASLAVLAAFAAASPAHAAALDLTRLTCAQYENEVLPAAPDNPDADSIDTVMWLYGYAVARSGQHVLSTDALAPFGFALDGECKTNPREMLLDALGIVKPETKNAMDISVTECRPFAIRHREFARTDSESAKTIMMWLLGFAEAGAGGHTFDASARPAFEAALLEQCDSHPTAKLVDAVTAVKKPARKQKPAARPAAKPPAAAS